MIPLFVFIFILGTVCAATYEIAARWEALCLQIRRIQRFGQGWLIFKWFSRRCPKPWRQLARWLSPSTNTGPYLVVGLTLCAAAIGLFVDIAEDVVGPEKLAEFDARFSAGVHRSAVPSLVRTAKALTILGSAPVIGTVALTMGIILVAKRDWASLIGWAAVMAGAIAIPVILKQFFRRPRPHFETSFLMDPTWSFPSGHAIGSLLCYGMLAYLVTRPIRTPRNKGIVVAIAAGLIMMVGGSRIYLGAHYLSDVVAGYAAAIVWLIIAMVAVELRRESRTCSGVE